MALAESNIAEAVTEVFRDLHGDIAFTLAFVHGFGTAFESSVIGECDFNQNPPLISIRSGLSESDLVEALCHELAHLRCGLIAGHDETWEKCRDDLSVRFWARCFG